MIRCRGLSIVLVVAWVLAFSVAPVRSQPTKFPDIPGFETKKIEGFTLFVDPETTKHEGDYKRPPSEVLQLELKLLSRILNPKALAAVKRLPFWVEWDEAPDIGNTRGTVLAYYLSADLMGARRLGEHPLRAKTITICNLKTLTSLHQPEVDKGQCILLHEVAHAVHDQLIGYGNLEIVTAYQQAMVRKLYEPGLYAASSSKEFFAEMTCAYLDRLEYFPRNRGDLKKHDPLTFKLMDKFWSRAASAEAAKSMTGTRREKVPEDLTQIVLEKMEPGTIVQKNPPSFSKRNGKLLAMAFWHDDVSSSIQDLERVKKFQDRFAEWGIDMLLVTPADSNAIRSARTLKDKGINLPACAGLAGDVKIENVRPPLVIVFDPDGKAIFRGPDFASEALYRRLGMTQKLEDSLETLEAGTERSEWDKIRDQIKRGDDLATVLKQVNAYTRYPDEDLVSQAQMVESSLEKPLLKLLENWDEESTVFPARSFLHFNRLAFNYKGTHAGAKAREMADKLKSNAEVQSELKAQTLLESMRKSDVQLTRMQTAGGFLPLQATPILNQMQSTMKQMEEKYPKSFATADARLIVRKFFPFGIPTGIGARRPNGP